MSHVCPLICCCCCTHVHLTSNLDNIGPNEYKWSYNGGETCFKATPTSPPVCVPDGQGMKGIKISTALQDSYFMTVSAGGSGPATYQLEVISGTLAKRLCVPSNSISLGPSNEAPSATRVGIKPAMLMLADGSSVESMAITYSVYAVKTSDLGGSNAYQTEVACGLSTYSETQGQVPTVYTSTQLKEMNFELPLDYLTLAERTSYTFNVVAQCDAACQGVSATTQGVTVQELAYSSASLTTGNYPPPPSAGTGLLLVVTLGVVGLAVLSTGM